MEFSKSCPQEHQHHVSWELSRNLVEVSVEVEVEEVRPPLRPTESRNLGVKHPVF